MNANLYINETTFKYAESDTIENIAVKISKFAELLCFVVPKNQDRFFARHNDFYSTVLTDDNVTLYDFLFDSENCPNELRDAKEILRFIIANIENIDCTNDELIDLINNHNSCNALVVMNKFKDNRISNEKQIISTKNGWYDFHRNYLVKNHGDIDFFLKEIENYFEKLVLHNDNKNSIKKVFKSHLRKIVQYLAYLNDNLLDEFTESQENDFKNFLESFRIKHNLDGASYEGEKRSDFKKCFCINGTDTECYCEPHLKIHTDDNEKRCPCRIHFKTPTKQDNKIYIGIITDHL